MVRPVTKFAAAALLILCVAGFAAGQAENRKLVIGSVFRVVKNLIEVKQEEGDIAVLHVAPATTYINSSTQAPAKLKDIAVGDQIVVKVITKDGVETADQVRFVPALRTRN
jgi:hypothetical protein